MIAAAVVLVTAFVICAGAFLAAEPPIVTNRLPAVARVKTVLLRHFKVL